MRGSIDIRIYTMNYALANQFLSFPRLLIATSRSDPLGRTDLEANRQLISQSKTPSTLRVEGERGSASSRFDLGECALALAFRLRNIIAHLGV